MIPLFRKFTRKKQILVLGFKNFDKKIKFTNSRDVFLSEIERQKSTQILWKLAIFQKMFRNSRPDSPVFEICYNNYTSYDLPCTSMYTSSVRYDRHYCVANIGWIFHPREKKWSSCSKGANRQCSGYVYHCICHEWKGKKCGGRHSNAHIIWCEKERTIAYTHKQENVRSEKAELHSIKLYIHLCTIEC